MEHKKMEPSKAGKLSKGSWDEGRRVEESKQKDEQRIQVEEEWMSSQKKEEETDLSSSNLVSRCLLSSFHKMDRHRQKRGTWMQEDEHGVWGVGTMWMEEGDANIDYVRFVGLVWGGGWWGLGRREGVVGTQHNNNTTQQWQNNTEDTNKIICPPTTNKIAHGYSETSDQSRREWGQERLKWNPRV